METNPPRRLTRVLVHNHQNAAGRPEKLAGRALANRDAAGMSFSPDDERTTAPRTAPDRTGGAPTGHRHRPENY
ncbi:hypothetical protein GCM10017688_09300 [Streptomyces ramulosus]